MSLFDSLKPYLKPGMNVLDIGAGDFEDAVAMRDLGCHVTALDIRQPSSVPPNITFVQQEIETFASTKTFDVIFMNFVANFLDKDILFQKILPRFAEAQILAIRTFSGRPEPSDPAKPITLYQPEDFSDLLWEPVVLKTWDEAYPGTDGVDRLWHLIEYIGLKKPQNP